MAVFKYVQVKSSGRLEMLRVFWKRPRESRRSSQVLLLASISR